MERMRFARVRWRASKQAKRRKELYNRDRRTLCGASDGPTRSHYPGISDVDEVRETADSLDLVRIIFAGLEDTASPQLSRSRFNGDRRIGGRGGERAGTIGAAIIQELMMVHNQKHLAVCDVYKNHR